MADLGQLFHLGQQVQGRLQQLQSDLAGRLIETSAGGGVVRVVADGRGTIRSLTIDAAAYEQRDAELLSDLVLGAIAEAQRRAAELATAEMGRLPPLALPQAP